MLITRELPPLCFDDELLSRLPDAAHFADAVAELDESIQHGAHQVTLAVNAGPFATLATVQPLFSGMSNV